ncbi:titin-like [Galendromus occidentalis]|uniref:Titin-like n=1 Tax=Galendromus occidentalis TaxID=34638 RepID=A0AAJ7P948_9ACAR|nr:titin-like [Galendromus occidentalis]
MIVKKEIEEALPGEGEPSPTEPIISLEETQAEEMVPGIPEFMTKRLKPRRKPSRVYDDRAPDDQFVVLSETDIELGVAEVKERKLLRKKPSKIANQAEELSLIEIMTLRKHEDHQDISLESIGYPELDVLQTIPIDVDSLGRPSEEITEQRVISQIDAEGRKRRKTVRKSKKPDGTVCKTEETTLFTPDEWEVLPHTFDLQPAEETEEIEFDSGKITKRRKTKKVLKPDNVHSTEITEIWEFKPEPKFFAVVSPADVGHPEMAVTETMPVSKDLYGRPIRDIVEEHTTTEIEPLRKTTTVEKKKKRKDGVYERTLDVLTEETDQPQPLEFDRMVEDNIVLDVGRIEKKKVKKKKPRDDEALEGGEVVIESLRFVPKKSTHDINFTSIGYPDLEVLKPMLVEATSSKKDVVEESTVIFIDNDRRPKKRTIKTTTTKSGVLLQDIETCEVSPEAFDLSLIRPGEVIDETKLAKVGKTKKMKKRTSEVKPSGESVERTVTTTTVIPREFALTDIVEDVVEEMVEEIVLPDRRLSTITTTTTKRPDGTVETEIEEVVPSGPEPLEAIEQDETKMRPKKTRKPKKDKPRAEKGPVDGVTTSDEGPRSQFTTEDTIELDTGKITKKTTTETVPDERGGERPVTVEITVYKPKPEHRFVDVTSIGLPELEVRSRTPVEVVDREITEQVVEVKHSTKDGKPVKRKTTTKKTKKPDGTIEMIVKKEIEETLPGEQEPSPSEPVISHEGAQPEEIVPGIPEFMTKKLKPRRKPTQVYEDRAPGDQFVVLSESEITLDVADVKEQKLLRNKPSKSPLRGEELSLIEIVTLRKHEDHQDISLESIGYPELDVLQTILINVDSLGRPSEEITEQRVISQIDAEGRKRRKTVRKSKKPDGTVCKTEETTLFTPDEWETLPHTFDLQPVEQSEDIEFDSGKITKRRKSKKVLKPDNVHSTEITEIWEFKPEPKFFAVVSPADVGHPEMAVTETMPVSKDLYGRPIRDIVEEHTTTEIEPLRKTTTVETKKKRKDGVYERTLDVLTEQNDQPQPLEFDQMVEDNIVLDVGRIEKKKVKKKKPRDDEALEEVEVVIESLKFVPKKSTHDINFTSIGYPDLEVLKPMLVEATSSKKDVVEESTVIFIDNDRRPKKRTIKTTATRSGVLLQDIETCEVSPETFDLSLIRPGEVIDETKLAKVGKTKKTKKRTSEVKPSGESVERTVTTTTVTPREFALTEIVEDVVEEMVEEIVLPDGRLSTITTTTTKRPDGTEETEIEEVVPSGPKSLEAIEQDEIKTRPKKTRKPKKVKPRAERGPVDGVTTSDEGPRSQFTTEDTIELETGKITKKTVMETIDSVDGLSSPVTVEITVYEPKPEHRHVNVSSIGYPELELRSSASVEILDRELTEEIVEVKQTTKDGKPVREKTTTNRSKKPDGTVEMIVTKEIKESTPEHPEPSILKTTLDEMRSGDYVPEAPGSAIERPKISGELPQLSQDETPDEQLVLVAETRMKFEDVDVTEQKIIRKKPSDGSRRPTELSLVEIVTLRKREEGQKISLESMGYPELEVLHTLPMSVESIARAAEEIREERFVSQIDAEGKPRTKTIKKSRKPDGTVSKIEETTLYSADEWELLPRTFSLRPIEQTEEIVFDAGKVKKQKKTKRVPRPEGVECFETSEIWKFKPDLNFFSVVTPETAGLPEMTVLGAAPVATDQYGQPSSFEFKVEENIELDAGRVEKVKKRLPRKDALTDKDVEVIVETLKFIPKEDALAIDLSSIGYPELEVLKPCLIEAKSTEKDVVRESTAIFVDIDAKLKRKTVKSTATKSGVLLQESEISEDVPETYDLTTVNVGDVIEEVTVDEKSTTKRKRKTFTETAPTGEGIERSHTVVTVTPHEYVLSDAPRRTEETTLQKRVLPDRRLSTITTRTVDRGDGVEESIVEETVTALPREDIFDEPFTVSTSEKTVVLESGELKRSASVMEIPRDDGSTENVVIDITKYEPKPEYRDVTLSSIGYPELEPLLRTPIELFLEEVTEQMVETKRSVDRGKPIVQKVFKKKTKRPDGRVEIIEETRTIEQPQPEVGTLPGDSDSPGGILDDQVGRYSEYLPGSGDVGSGDQFMPISKREITLPGAEIEKCKIVRKKKPKTPREKEELSVIEVSILRRQAQPHGVEIESFGYPDFDVLQTIPVEVDSSGRPIEERTETRSIIRVDAKGRPQRKTIKKIRKTDGTVSRVEEKIVSDLDDIKSESPIPDSVEPLEETEEIRFDSGKITKRRTSKRVVKPDDSSVVETTEVVEFKPEAKFFSVVSPESVGLPELAVAESPLVPRDHFGRPVRDSVEEYSTVETEPGRKVIRVIKKKKRKDGVYERTLNVSTEEKPGDSFPDRTVEESVTLDVGKIERTKTKKKVPRDETPLELADITVESLKFVPKKSIETFNFDSMGYPELEVLKPMQIEATSRRKDVAEEICTIFVDSVDRKPKKKVTKTRATKEGVIYQEIETSELIPETFDLRDSKPGDVIDETIVAEKQTSRRSKKKTTEISPSGVVIERTLTMSTVTPHEFNLTGPELATVDETVEETILPDNRVLTTRTTVTKRADGVVETRKEEILPARPDSSEPDPSTRGGETPEKKRGEIREGSPRRETPLPGTRSQLVPEDCPPSTTTEEQIELKTGKITKKLITPSESEEDGVHRPVTVEVTIYEPKPEHRYVDVSSIGFPDLELRSKVPVEVLQQEVEEREVQLKHLTVDGKALKQKTTTAKKKKPDGTIEVIVSKEIIEGVPEETEPTSVGSADANRGARVVETVPDTPEFLTKKLKPCRKPSRVSEDRAPDDQFVELSESDIELGVAEVKEQKLLRKKPSKSPLRAEELSLIEIVTLRKHDDHQDISLESIGYPELDVLQTIPINVDSLGRPSEEITERRVISQIDADGRKRQKTVRKSKKPDGTVCKTEETSLFTPDEWEVLPHTFDLQPVEQSEDIEFDSGKITKRRKTKKVLKPDNVHSTEITEIWEFKPEPKFFAVVSPADVGHPEMAVTETMPVSKDLYDRPIRDIVEEHTTTEIEPLRKTTTVETKKKRKDGVYERTLNVLTEQNDQPQPLEFDQMVEDNIVLDVDDEALEEVEVVIESLKFVPKKSTHDINFTSIGYPDLEVLKPMLVEATSSKKDVVEESTVIFIDNDRRPKKRTIKTTATKSGVLVRDIETCEVSPETFDLSLIRPGEVIDETTLAKVGKTKKMKKRTSEVKPSGESVERTVTTTTVTPREFAVTDIVEDVVEEMVEEIVLPDGRLSTITTTTTKRPDGTVETEIEEVVPSGPEPLEAIEQDEIKTRSKKTRKPKKDKPRAEEGSVDGVTTSDEGPKSQFTTEDTIELETGKITRKTTTETVPDERGGESPVTVEITVYKPKPEHRFVDVSSIGLPELEVRSRTPFEVVDREITEQVVEVKHSTKDGKPVKRKTTTKKTKKPDGTIEMIVTKEIEETLPGEQEPSPTEPVISHGGAQVEEMVPGIPEFMTKRLKPRGKPSRIYDDRAPDDQFVVLSETDIELGVAEVKKRKLLRKKPSNIANRGEELSLIEITTLRKHDDHQDISLESIGYPELDVLQTIPINVDSLGRPSEEITEQRVISQIDAECRKRRKTVRKSKKPYGTVCKTEETTLFTPDEWETLPHTFDLQPVEQSEDVEFDSGKITQRRKTKKVLKPDHVHSTEITEKWEFKPEPKFFAVVSPADVGHPEMAVTETMPVSKDLYGRPIRDIVEEHTTTEIEPLRKTTTVETKKKRKDGVYERTLDVLTEETDQPQPLEFDQIVEDNIVLDVGRIEKKKVKKKKPRDDEALEEVEVVIESLKFVPKKSTHDINFTSIGYPDLEVLKPMLVEATSSKKDVVEESTVIFIDNDRRPKKRTVKTTATKSGVLLQDIETCDVSPESFDLSLIRPGEVIDETKLAKAGKTKKTKKRTSEVKPSGESVERTVTTTTVTPREFAVTEIVEDVVEEIVEEIVLPDGRLSTITTTTTKRPDGTVETEIEEVVPSGPEPLEAIEQDEIKTRPKKTRKPKKDKPRAEKGPVDGVTPSDEGSKSQFTAEDTIELETGKITKETTTETVPDERGGERPVTVEMTVYKPKPEHRFVDVSSIGYPELEVRSRTPFEVVDREITEQVVEVKHSTKDGKPVKRKTTTKKTKNLMAPSK